MVKITLSNNREYYSDETTVSQVEKILTNADTNGYKYLHIKTSEEEVLLPISMIEEIKAVDHRINSFDVTANIDTDMIVDRIVDRITNSLRDIQRNIY